MLWRESALKPSGWGRYPKSRCFLCRWLLLVNLKWDATRCTKGFHTAKHGGFKTYSEANCKTWSNTLNCMLVLDPSSQFVCTRAQHVSKRFRTSLRNRPKINIAEFVPVCWLAPLSRVTVSFLSTSEPSVTVAGPWAEGAACVILICFSGLFPTGILSRAGLI